MLLTRGATGDGAERGQNEAGTKGVDGNGAGRQNRWKGWMKETKENVEEGKNGRKCAIMRTRGQEKESENKASQGSVVTRETASGESAGGVEGDAGTN